MRCRDVMHPRKLGGMKSVMVLALLGAGVAAAQPLPPPAPTTLTRPRYIRNDAGVGAPTGIMGLSIGGLVSPTWAIEGGFGLGATGWQLALLGRWYRPVFNSPYSSLSLAAGPSLSMIGKPVGTNVPHDDSVQVDDGDIFTIFGLNAEVGFEWRMHWGGLVRVALGGFLRVHETMAHLCSEETSGSESGPCGSLHLPTAPEIARLVAYPYLVFGYGWSF